MADGRDFDLWSARDALVLKVLIMVLADFLPVFPCCTHIKGHGGAKAAVRLSDPAGRNNVKPEQASKATMRMPTLLPFREGSTRGEEIDRCTRSVRRGSGRGTSERCSGYLSRCHRNAPRLAPLATLLKRFWEELGRVKLDDIEHQNLRDLGHRHHRPFRHSASISPPSLR